MTKNQSLISRIILFLFGAGVIALAFFLITNGNNLADTDVFVWVSIGVMYLLFFTPFFFSSLPIAGFSGKIPSLAMVWTGVVFYIIASIVVIILLKTTVSLNTAVIIQAVLLFLFAIDIYFGYFASSHVRNVAVEERAKSHLLAGIKAQAQALALAIKSLPGEYETAQKMLASALDEIKYLSPVDGGAGDNLEQRISVSLNAISELCDNVSTGGHPSLDAEAHNLQTCVKTRKLLRN